jgi:WD40 repeat protein
MMRKTTQSPMRPADPPQPISQVLDRADELYRLWQAGPPPDLDTFIAQFEPLSPPELAAVMRVDQRCRWGIDQRIPAEDYLAQYPSLLDDRESTLDFIYGELLLREQHGEFPDSEDFVARFPDQADVLRQQIELHRALCAESPAGRIDHSPALQKSGFASLAGDRYEIIREIGRGGMGVVYEARQAGVNRIVALKVLSAGTHAGPEQLSRFRAEAELIGRLQHPHIVQIHESGQQDGCPFLALEYVRGGSLRNRLKGEPQLPVWSARLVETLARAVHAAHQAGVVHRDLKPGNILFTPGPSGDSGSSAPDASWSADEIPKIADFGLAKALWGSAADGNSESLTRTGDILGTPSYMSPEQAAGRGEQIGPATDIYALGAILYELLTGRPPFQGVTGLETLQHVASEEPVPPSRLQPRLPRDLEVICLKCLQKQAQQRYATAIDLAEDLQRFLTNEPIRARPTPRLARLGRWCRRKPTLASLGAVVVLLVVTLVLGSMAATINSRRAADDLRAEARVAEALAVRLSDRMGRREQSRALLSEAARLRPSSQVRDEAITGMALFDLPVVGLGPELAPDHWQINFDGHLARYAESTRAGLIVVSRVVDHVEICRIPELIPTAMLMLSPDGNYLAARSGAGQSLSVWSLEGDVPHVVHRELCRGDIGIGAFSFSHDNQLFAMGRPDGTVSVRSLPSGELYREWKFDSGAQHLAFHPERPQIAMAGRDPVQIRDYESGRMLVRLEETAGATWVAWHPEGKLLATADADLGITLWEPDEFRRYRKLRGHDSQGIELGFNNSGTMLCSQAWDGVLRFWDPFDGSLLFSSRTESVRALRSAADRNVWAGSNKSGKILFWRADEHEVYRRLTSGFSAAAQRYDSVAISPQGIARNRLLAATTLQGVRLWDLATGQCIGFLQSPAVGRVQFDETGALWTNSRSGIQRWPIQESTQERGTLVVGPATRVLAAGTNGDLALTPDGRTVAFGGTSGAYLWHADRPESLQELKHRDPRFVAVSPDGRWVATGSHTDTEVKIWDAGTGSLVRELALLGSRVEFSPDGAWVSSTSGGLALWSVGDWKRAWKAAGDSSSAQAFSSDGRVVADGVGAGVIVLHESASGREVARLADPDGQRPNCLTFSPDQRYLASISFDFKNLYVWDLHEIDRQLTELGVAWQWPSSRAAPPVEPDRVPLKIASRVETRSEAFERELREVAQQLDSRPQDEPLHLRRGWLLYALDRPSEAIDALTQAIGLAANAATYSLRAHAHARANDYPRAISDARAALAAIESQDPRQGQFCNHLAWYLVTAPPELRQPEQAVELARRALRHEPGRATYLNTLGVALCRRGEWDESVDALQRSLRTGSDGPACDLYFLAVCFHHLRKDRLATEAFEQAIYWHDNHESHLDPQNRAEFAKIRGEVEAVLGLSEEIRQTPKPETPVPP